MTTLAIVPSALTLRLYRGDDTGFKLTFASKGEPLELPTEGWEAQVRARANAESPLLGSFTIDASEAADGILRISITGADTLALPKKAKWDLQNSHDGIKTYLAGDLLVDDQVTQ